MVMIVSYNDIMEAYNESNYSKTNTKKNISSIAYACKKEQNKH